MRNLQVIVLFFLALNSGAQVTIKTNLLSTIPLRRSIVFDVKIVKGDLGNFSRFQIDVPPGIIIESVDSRGGTYSLLENKVKIIWVSTPTETELAVRLKLLPVREAGQGAFLFRYYYVEQDVKKEFHAREYRVRFRDTIMPVLLSSQMVDLNPEKPIVKTESSAQREMDARNTAAIQDKVQKLRQESAQAFAVGEKEKKKAQAKLRDIERQEQEIGSETGAEATRLRKEKSQAQEALATAEKVLTLAKKLERDADEIDKINKGANPAASGDDMAPKAGAGTGTGHVEYRVQIGSFSKRPATSPFRRYGKVTVGEENGIFKLYLGSFADKARAYELRDRISSEFPGSFVVTLPKEKKNR